MCGYRRKIVKAPIAPAQPVDVQSIDSRLRQLHMQSLSTSYAKQKTSLKAELESFLMSLPGQKSLCSAMPVDVCRFLAWKSIMSIVPIAPTSEPTHVIVRYVYLTTPLTPT
jgi:hypothetical protein